MPGMVLNEQNICVRKKRNMSYQENRYEGWSYAVDPATVAFKVSLAGCS
jgi:hypothetical protein